MVEELGGKALMLPADTRDPDQVKAMVDAGMEKFGAIDILELFRFSCNGLSV